MKSFPLSLSALLLLTACQQIDLGDYANTSSNDDTYEVNITSKSGESGVELPYPLTVYAVNEEDAIQDKVIINDGSKTGILSLPSGNYILYATAGEKVENSSKIEDNCISAENGYFMNPIMQGSEVISVEDDDLNENITLSYAVASLCMTINDVPGNVIPISVKVSSQSETMSIARDYDGSSSATLSFSKQDDGSWKTERAYLFPGTGSNTNLTITYKVDENTTKVFSAKFNKPLEAGIPYELNCSYNSVSDKSLTLSFDVQGWGVPIEETLEFEEVITESDTPQLNDASVVEWQNHVLIKINNNTGLLFSKNVWEKNQIEAALSSNTEGISGWEIPSSEQVSQIKQVPAIELRDIIANVGGTTKKFVDYYYLCDNGEKAFSFKSNNIISSTSQKDENYKIRLVKQVTF